MNTTEEKVKELQEMIGSLGEIEMDVLTSFTLADAIREGSSVSDQKIGGWGSGDQQCALHAAVTSAVARGYLG